MVINYEQRSDDLAKAICETLNHLRDIGNLIEVNDEEKAELHGLISETHDKLKVKSREALGYT